MLSGGRVKRLLAAQPLNYLHVCHVHSDVGQDPLEQHSAHFQSLGMLALTAESYQTIDDLQAHAQV